MKVNISHPESWKVVLDIEVPQDLVKQEVDGVFTKLQQSASLSGFRKGKAPLEMVKRHFEHQAKKEVIDKLIPEAMEKALKDNNIEPINIPLIDDLKFEFDQPLGFKASIEVKPNINLGSYKKIKIKKKIVKVDEHDIDKSIKELQEKGACLILATHDCVQEGDFVLINYEGPKLDDLKEPFKIEKRANQLVRVGDEGIEKFLPGFTRSLIGIKREETNDVHVTFPSDHKNKDLAGKEIVFKVTIQEIKEKKLPDINDDFAKELGFDNLEKLKTKITERLTQQQEAQIQHSMEEQLIDELIKNNSLEYPPSLVESEIDYIVSKTKNYFMAQGLNTKQMGISDEELRQKSKEEAVRKVKTNLIIEAITQKENIDVSEEEINQQMQDLITEMNTQEDTATPRVPRKTPEEIKEYWTHHREGIIEQMKRIKTFKFLMDNANIKEEK